MQIYQVKFKLKLKIIIIEVKGATHLIFYRNEFREPFLDEDRFCPKKTSHARGDLEDIKHQANY